VSALALMKMTAHCKRGGDIEVMGMLQGYAKDDAFIVLDVFELPVEGTETRVNAQAEAYEYMVEYTHTCKAVGRHENVVGWYHSHPGYGCWLSGIDVNTQSMNQRYGEPFLAIVIDPIRTSRAEKVEIGAFRTYPDGYTAPEEPSTSSNLGIPKSKIEDFGVHANKYYSLDVSFFKSSLDARNLDSLTKKYWVNTLSSSTLLANRKLIASQVSDMEGKIAKAEKEIKRGGPTTTSSASLASMSMSPTSGSNLEKAGDVSALGTVTQDAISLAIEQSKMFASYAVKCALFDAVSAHKEKNDDVEMQAADT
jgi:COP9 signalosome complex subunit 5